MKKKRLNVFPFRESIQKIIRVMKLVSFFLLVGLLQVSANIYSQTANIHLSLKETSLSEVIKEIQKQTEFTFFYSPEDVKGVVVSKIELEKASLEKVLDLCLDGTSLEYEIVHKAVILKKGTAEKSTKGLPDARPLEQPATKKIKGKVIDSKGEPIPGTTIKVSGSTTGTIADINGEFTLNVPLDSKNLSFSFIGYISQELLISDKLTFNVVLEENTVGVEEVVVVGYGLQKKETMVGAVSQVDNKTLMQSGTTNISNAIAGKLSGILTMQQTGEPGKDNAEIVIRGLSSWNSSNPLTLVDGVERDFKDLDPNEINTISVLKDASATAVFGAKGANGVIIVTTKRGTLGKPKMDFTASYGMEKATNIPEHIDSYTTMNMLNYAYKNERRFSDLIPDHILEEYRNPSTPLNALRYPNVNWFDETTKPFAPTTNANINLNGGTDFVKYFVSLGYTHQGSYFKAFNAGYDDTRFWYNRFNYRTNLDFKLTKTTQLSFNIGGDVGIKNQPTGSPWWALYGSSPARFPAYFPDWVLKEVPDPDYPEASGIRLAQDFGEYTGNPYTLMNNGSFNRYLESKLFTDILLKQDLDFIAQGLSFQGKVSLSTYYRNRSLYATHTFPEYQLYYDKINTSENPWYRENEGNEVYKMPPLAINTGGLENGYYKDLYYEFALNYNHVFGSHGISALALMNRQQKDQGTEFPYYNEGLVGRITYDYSKKYLVEMNVGYTGSERFAPENRFGFFPSGAIGWVISEEQFFKNLNSSWFSKFKLRYSDGLVGSDYAANRWLYMSDYYKDSRGYIREDKAANTSAQWEEARKRDLGIEMGFFDNSFTLGVDLFDEYRSKMLLTPLSTPILIGNSFKELNLGELKKHGIEIEAEYRKTLKNDFNYYLKGIFSFNENRIINKDDPPYTPEYQKEAGKPLGAQRSGVLLTGSGYYTCVDDIHNNFAPIALSSVNVGDYMFLDYRADGAITTLDTYPIKGSLYPPVVFSFSGGFSYKKFDFSFLWQGNTGKYVEFNQSYETEFTKGNYRVHASQLDYWSPENPNANHATPHYYGSGYMSILSWSSTSEATGYSTIIEDRFWRRADYLKLKEVYVGYTFQPKWHKIPGLSSINIYATGNNLLTITNLIEGDPERKDFSKGYYPQMLSAKVGMKLSF